MVFATILLGEQTALFSVFEGLLAIFVLVLGLAPVRSDGSTRHFELENYVIRLLVAMNFASQ